MDYKPTIIEEQSISRLPRPIMYSVIIVSTTIIRDEITTSRQKNHRRKINNIRKRKKSYKYLKRLSQILNVNVTAAVKADINRQRVV
jgi:hypothetical protein